MRNSFTVFTRKTKTGKSSYHARFFDADGKVIKTISLPEAKSKNAAFRAADTLLKKGIVSDEKNPLALDFLLSFWDQNSDYVRLKEKRQGKLSVKYLYEQKQCIKHHLTKHLQSVRIADIDAIFLDKLILKLDEAGVGPRRINVVLQAVRVPVGYFCKLHRIPNPLAGFEKVAETSRERGILTFAEVSKIINLENESPRIKSAVLLAALCGLRLGECRGLLWSDIDFENGTINIQIGRASCRERV